MTSVLDLLPDGVLSVDGDRVIVSANAAAVELTGYPLDDLVGRDIVQLLEPRGGDGRAAWTNGWPRSARLRSVRGIPEQEVTFRRSDGGIVRAYVTGSYERDSTGSLSGVVLVLRDAGTRLHKATSGIEIVSTVSHELRSPLTSVKGYTSLLLNRWDRFSDDQKKEMLEQVKHDADRVHRLITELLDISRLETGRLVLRRQMVDLAGLAAAVVDKVRFAYPDIEAHLRFPADLPKAHADADKIEQVLTNLVENACKYASPRGIRIVGVARSAEIAVSVSDRGEGIPAEDLLKVFTKFFRRELGRPTGSGLGLWISRGMVEAHGGRLTATSAPGEGTTFRFTIPFAEADER